MCIYFDLVFVLGGYGNANEGSGKAIVPLVFVLTLFLIPYGKTLERLHPSRCLNTPLYVFEYSHSYALGISIDKSPRQIWVAKQGEGVGHAFQRIPHWFGDGSSAITLGNL